MATSIEVASATHFADPASWRCAIDRVVTQARLRANAEFDADALLAAGVKRWAAVLADTPLAEVDAHLPVDDPLFVMAATVLVTQRAVELVLAGSQEPLVLASAVARLVETSLRAFTDPRTGRTYRHLAAAKRAGAFFTPPDVALRMASAALVDRPVVRRCLEPASGTGMLSAAMLLAAAAQGARVGSVEAWETSPYVARIGGAVLTAVADRLGACCEVKVLPVDALDRFDEGATGKFPDAGASEPHGYDVVLLNPPYGRIKFLRSSLTNAETRAGSFADAESDSRSRIQLTRAKVHHLAADLGLGRGTPDYQRLFIAGAHRLLSPGGRLVVIAPSAWTSGREAADLRTALLERRSLVSLTLYSEDCQLFATVNQPTAVAVFDQVGGAAGFDVSDIDPRTRAPRDAFSIGYGELTSHGPNPWRIPLISSDRRDAYRHLAAAPRLGESRHVNNARGELDLTLDSELVTADVTPVRLVRGDHVERYVLRGAHGSQRAGYVTLAGAAEMRLRPKGTDARRQRVVGRQCSYIGKGRRLSFAVVPAGVIVANSCNYVVTADDEDAYAAAAVLNSAVAEWWFRVHSSNNHVSNYEIDDLPWPAESADVTAALRAVGRQLHEAYAAAEFGVSKIGSSVEDVADALVCYGLGLASPLARLVLQDIDATRAQRVAGMVAWFERHGLPASLSRGAAEPQHAVPTLSALDVEMLQYVPQGGNWQNIPESVPSARLAQIRAMTAERGIVRTTYYGRLRPDQPAYTIATYYNRPGNGTNIHPHEDRTLTSREAARLQSFPDAYVFFGTEGAVRRQIGNAVPPLLGYAVGRQLMSAGCAGPVVDLFAGAGGLSTGLEMAGCEIIAAVDNDAACQSSYTFNRACESFGDPGTDNTLFVRADLSQASARASALKAIRQKLGSRSVGAVVGGPPCQGFSHAGFRSSADARNDLAVVFLDFVRWLRPEIVVLENVEGLLTSRKGATIAALMQTLRGLGYATDEPWLLAAECFGVPQMRRRVFVVASRSMTVERPAAVLSRCSGRRERPGVDGVLPYPVTVAEALAGLPRLQPVSHPDPGTRAVRSSYLRWALGLIPAATLVDGLEQGLC